MHPFAVLSDIHGNLPALEAVLTDLDRRGLTEVVNLGDNASGPLWPRETLAVLRAQTAWVQIAGNHDRQLVRQAPETHGASDRYAYQQLDRADLDWLAGLPADARLEGDVLLCHGRPGDDNQYLLKTVAGGRVHLARPAEIADRLQGARARLVLCGHSHTPRVVHLDSDLLAANPGSVGLQAYDHDAPGPHVVETGSPHARYLVVELREPVVGGDPAGSWHLELVAVPYDHGKAADQAARNRRPEWEAALRTGFLAG